MKRIGRQKICCAALLLICLTALTVSAQHGYRIEKRVEFPQGKTTIRLKGRIPNTLEGHDYILEGVEGERISARVSSPKIRNVVIVVSDDRYQPLEGGSSVKSWSGRLPKTGVYHIIVATIYDRPASYTLDINKHNQ